jgi:hypothetical protein
VITDPAVRAADPGHAEVNIGREPSVQLGFPLACRRAGPPRGEVKETQRSRLVSM